MSYKFDYETKIWGGGRVTTSPSCLTAPKLLFALDSLKGLNKGAKVLEVGCGAGGISKAIKRYRKNLLVHGVDISKIQLKIAVKNSEGVNFKLGSAYKLPFKNKSMDAVVMFDVLEHLDNPKKAISEIKRVLKPKGIFSLFTPIEGNLLSLHGVSTKFFGFTPKEKYGGHIQNFTYSDVYKLISDEGMAVKTHNYYGHYFNQLVDFLYFAILYIRGKNVQGSIESMIEKEKNLKTFLIKIIKDFISIVSFIESKLLFFFPGSGVNIKSTVNDNKN